MLNSFIFYDKVNPGKIRFMQCKLDIVEKTINRARAANIPQIYHVPQFNCHFFGTDTSDREKIKPTEEVRCLYNKENKKGVKVSLQ